MDFEVCGRVLFFFEEMLFCAIFFSRRKFDGDRQIFLNC